MALSLPPELWEMIGLCLIDQDPLSSPAGMAHDIAALGCTSKDPNLQAGVAVAWRALEGCCRVRSTPRVCPPAFGSWRVVWAHVNTYSLDQLRACLRALGSSFIGNRAATLQQLLPILPTDWPGASPDLRDLVKSSRNNCITQTEALKQYRLQKEDLEGVRVRIRGNTHLYRVTDVMRLAQFKYGSAAGLQARNEQILEASAKRRRTAEYNQSMQGPRTQQIIKALAKAHVDYVLEDLLIPAAQKYIKSGTGSLAKVVAAVKALIATEVRTQEVQDLVQERDLPSAGWHRNLPEYQAYVDNGDGSLEDVIEAISEEAERRSLVEARRQQLTAAVGAEMDLLEMPICKDYVERNRGDLQAVLAMISDVAADRKWRRQEVDQLLATYDLADFSQLKTWSGNTVSQPCGFFQAYINGQADAAPLEQLAEQAFLQSQRGV
ncbi:hypothetical protein WJX72_003111 [[Myrmecia] bisecta]|uniref:Uncharacterized protein n=1 Tax=[Myrmecia] bisecta TaxID=41462 RepID=A0AAW1PFN5_9CHLO